MNLTPYHFSGAHRGRVRRIIGLALLGVWAVAAVPTLAGAIEPSSSTVTESPDRAVALRELQRTRRATEVARAAAIAARREVDQFVAEHFADLRASDQMPLPTPRQAKSVRKPVHNAEWTRLNSQRTELNMRRNELLQRVTPLHPDAIDLEQRIATLSQEMEFLGDSGAESVPPGDLVQDDNEVEIAERFHTQRQRHAMTMARYEALHAQADAAERALEQAFANESAAARKLAAIAADAVPAPRHVDTVPASRPIEPQPTVGEMEQATVPPQVTTSEVETAPSASRRAQPLALVALLVALAVAALVAVRLARSSRDAVFESVDDVAAALALPVMGVIPAAHGADVHAATATFGHRATFVLQLLLAFLFFAALAYGMQNPSLIWNAWNDAADAMGGLARFLGTQR